MRGSDRVNMSLQERRRADEIKKNAARVSRLSQQLSEARHQLNESMNMYQASMKDAITESQIVVSQKRILKSIVKAPPAKSQKITKEEEHKKPKRAKLS